MTFAELIVEPTEEGSTPDKPGDLNRILKEAAEAASQGADDGTEGTKPNDAAKVERPDWIEEKFWTGDMAESMEKQAKAYKPLQSSHGRMANDLGMQRKLTDELLAVRRNPDKTTETARPEIKGEDLVERPAETLEKFLASRDAAKEKETSERLARMELTLAQERFTSKHPDFEHIGTSEEFKAWVQATPYRSRVAAQAAAGDFLAADELLVEFKAQKATAPKGEKDENVEAARKVGLESGATTRDTTGKGRKKIWRRTDLQELQLRRPDIYYDDAFQTELLRAYDENRVR